jgi:hypothetical protein
MNKFINVDGLWVHPDFDIAQDESHVLLFSVQDAILFNRAKVGKIIENKTIDEFCIEYNKQVDLVTKPIIKLVAEQKPFRVVIEINGVKTHCIDKGYKDAVEVAKDVFHYREVFELLGHKVDIDLVPSIALKD